MSVTKTSVYIANNAADVTAAESWLGRKLDAIQLHQGVANWNDWLTSPAWEAQQVKSVQAEKMWSIGLIPYGATLAQAGTGAYDDKYTTLAKSLVANSSSTGQIYVRLGWEMNSTGWNPWSANGQAGDYVKAFQHAVDAMRGVSDRFVFEWTPNINTGVDPAQFYPGDKYVDVVGMDFYYDKQWDNKDGAQAFNYFVTEQYGLQWQQDFAKAHGKQTAIGEWGLNSDSPDYVKLASKWFSDHNMVYANYWNSDAAFQGNLSAGQYPNAAAAFKAMFGAQAYTGDIVVDTGATATTPAVPVTSPVTTVPVVAAPASPVVTVPANTLVGTAGDDTYVITKTGMTIGGVAGGHDTVQSSITYTLGDKLSDLTLTGTTAIDGTGNALDNVITGNAVANVLTGGGGHDHLYGGAGNDSLVAGAGNDYLDGGAGNDKMTGGAGDDTYLVDSSADQVVENANEGTDTVQSSINYTLGGNVENLVLIGSATTGTGNAGANIVTGNALANTLSGGDGNDTLHGAAGNDALLGGGGDDTLDGGSGADTLTGGDGNDIYIVDNIGDQVVEANSAKSGIDSVVSSVSYTLAANVEHLVLSGTAAINGTANALDNTILGNAAVNILHGGAGNDIIDGAGGADILYGDAGYDSFVFRKGEAQGDKVMDFQKGDHLYFEGYGSGAYATFADGKVTVHYTGGTETVTIAGVTPVASDWTLMGLQNDWADLVKVQADHLQ